MWVVFIPVAFIGLFCVYYYVIYPKMNAKSEGRRAALIEDFAATIKGREDEAREHLIRTDEHVEPLAIEIDDKDIVGIVSCQEKRDGKDALRQTAINAAGRGLGKMVGVGVKEVDNTEFYYLVLTKEQLHYLHFDEDGECKEHLYFERKNLEKIELGKVSSMDMLKNAAEADLERLSFESNGVPYKFFLFNSMYAFPTASDPSMEAGAKLDYLFVKPFYQYFEKYKNTLKA